MPRPAHAIGTLVKIVARLQAQPFPYRLVPATQTLMEHLARDGGGVFTDVLERLRAGTFDAAMLEGLPLPDYFIPELRAMLADTLTPTVLNGGSQINVVPAKARALFDGRILPDTDPRSVIEKVERCAASVTRNGWEVAPLSVSPGVGFSHRTALFETIEIVMRQHDPEARVIPYLCPGATDARHLRALPGVTVYGFRPMRQSPEAPRHTLVHGINERISVENLAFGARVLFDIIVRCCGTVS
jgi:acetylornithine deacetylase/succinyl-diaminopimelate desuccinylase-like protein